MKNQTVLLIEDDASIREGVRILLEAEGYMVEEAEDGSRGLGLLSDKISIVILDVMMPGISGIRVCKEIRRKSNVPVLFLTARGEDSDKLLGLEVGGDDYLTKPFSYVELLGRVKAILRRHTVYDQTVPEGQPEWLEAGGSRFIRNTIGWSGRMRISI
jgi:DNA-binding response OmpR family regulator